ncbi:zinc-ribbon and DUF3426 domain-containing protein [Paraburkholderia sp. ZP32-5]|uniref:zinc-ribbon and DUF3426 domain-containing protein n=1 Tax=Paraburkholderia sp. ZP32-5 TaxID=2883245 RepID=UPI001F342711|nr:zinc-ribbon and DUF3426 domain-containing protein [Paraburkholderia sp. ZP32-5]
MLLATRCPFCETVFSLQPAQLAQRRGLVRCGHCQEVFDASSSLFDVTDGGDFSKAKPVAAAAAIEALSGVRQKSPDFSGDAWDPWTPAAEPGAGAAAYSADQASVDTPRREPASMLDERLHDNAVHMPLAPLPLGGNDSAASAAPTPRTATEPELPAGGFTAPLPADHEPTLTDAPLEPFAYPADEPADEPPAAAVAPGASSANRFAASPVTAATAAPVTPAPAADEAPRVWHKAERTASSTLDEPVLGERAKLYGIPDNEPRFGTGSAGSTRYTAAASAGAAAASPDTGGGLGGPGGPAGPRPPGGFGPAAAPGEPFSVKPVNDGADPFPIMREPRPAEGRRVGLLAAGVVLAVLLVIALLAQLAWWQREAVQVAMPRSQVLYAKVCGYLGCQLTPPHDIDGLLVEPSDLRQVDGPHKLELKMPLHNRLNIALAYPAIELTLLDDQNNVAVRRVLWPQDYVPPGTVIAAGLPAHATQTMIVHLDTGNAIASNFRVQIFYP